MLPLPQAHLKMLVQSIRVLAIIVLVYLHVCMSLVSTVSVASDTSEGTAISVMFCKFIILNCLQFTGASFRASYTKV